MTRSGTGCSGRVRRTPLPLRWPIRQLWIGIGLVLVVFSGEMGFLGAKEQHVALTLLLLTHLALEVGYERLKRPDWWLVSPPVLASILTFAIPFGLTNLLFFGSSYQTYVFSGKGLTFFWLNKAVLLAIVASFFMWFGYHLRSGRTFGIRFRRWLKRRGLVRPSWRLSYLAVFLLYAASTICKVLLLGLGAFGYGAEGGIPRFQQFLVLGNDLSALCILIVAVDAFDARDVRGYSLLVAMVVLDVFWGFLAGFKSQVVFPLLMVVGGYYLARRRLPKSAVVLLGGALFLAYSVVGPYRQMIGAGGAAGGMGPSGRVEALTETITGLAGAGFRVGSGGSDVVGPQELLTSVAARANWTGVAAAAVRYGDETGRATIGPYEGPRISTIVTSPLRALVPRLVWPDKPTVSRIGAWFRVHGWRGPVDSTTSVGMSTVGYLYIAGGSLAVILCFGLLGLLQRFAWTAFFGPGGGLIVFVGLLGPLVRVPTAFDAVIVDLIRLVPLLILLQYVVVGRGRHRTVPRHPAHRQIG